MIICTLGNKEFPSTCSYAAVSDQFSNHQIELYQTFEEGIMTLKKGIIDMVVIPAAYPNINPIIMDENLKIEKVFLYKIPDLVLATNIYNSNKFETLYFHPATISLLDKIDKKFTFNLKEKVTSNTEAALKVVDSACNNVCITNKLCAEQQKLQILQIVRDSFNMPFICFTRRI